MFVLGQGLAAGLLNSTSLGMIHPWNIKRLRCLVVWNFQGVPRFGSWVLWEVCLGWSRSLDVFGRDWPPVSWAKETSNQHMMYHVAGVGQKLYHTGWLAGATAWIWCPLDPIIVEMKCVALCQSILAEILSDVSDIIYIYILYVVSYFVFPVDSVHVADSGVWRAWRLWHLHCIIIVPAAVNGKQGVQIYPTSGMCIKCISHVWQWTFFTVSIWMFCSHTASLTDKRYYAVYMYTRICFRWD